MTHAAGWYRDATGRHAQRYFDGHRWTDHVADAAGSQSMDPVVAGPSPSSPAVAATTWSATPERGWQAAPAGGSTATSFAPPSLPSTLTTPRPATVPTAGGVVLTVGSAVGAAGALLALLSILVLDYWNAGSVGISLGDIAGAPDGAAINGVAASYAGFGRYVGLLAVAAAVVAALRLPAMARFGEVPVVAASATVGVVGVWHLLGLFVAPDGAGMAVAGLLGVVGMAALAAAPFLRRELGRLA